jgi:hypothetical protein
VAAGGLALTASPARADHKYSVPYWHYPGYLQPYGWKGYSPGYAYRYSYAAPPSYYWRGYSGYPYSYGWPGGYYNGYYPGPTVSFGYQGPYFSFWYGR